MKTPHMSAEDERHFILSEGGTPVEVKCDVCGATHYQGKGYYPLRKVSGYEMFCCEICYEGNWDGWNRRYEEKILAYLKAKGIKPPKRNDNGWLPRDF